MHVLLTDGSVAVVDDEDYDLVSGYTWTAVKRGRVTHACTRIRVSDAGRKGGWKTVYIHRLVLGNPQGVVDHIDHNGLNNRKGNLRVGTQGQNTYNQRGKSRSDKTSKYKGVSLSSWNKNPKWVAAISVNKKRIYLGSFADELSAAKAYDSAALKYFGEFAYLNIKG